MRSSAYSVAVGVSAARTRWCCWCSPPKRGGDRPPPAYRDEQRARSELKALFETSPVAVVVVDAATGAAVSPNREAKGIVESLCMPDVTAEDLRETLAYRRAAGREIALAELPTVVALKNAKTMRAKETELTVPDRRRPMVLVIARLGHWGHLVVGVARNCSGCNGQEWGHAPAHHDASCRATKERDVTKLLALDRLDIPYLSSGQSQRSPTV